MIEFMRIPLNITTLWHMSSLVRDTRI